jgi:hypothetical protein
MTQLTTDLLPERFRDLESFAREWSLEQANERSEKRLSNSMEEITAFYEAIMPRMEAILEYLNEIPLDQMPDDAARLLWLTLSLAEISPAIHFYGQPDVVDGFDSHRFQSVRVPNFRIPGDRSIEVVAPPHGRPR